MRAVLDPNVIISALLAPGGTPAKVLRLWLDGGYEMVTSPRLLAELKRALAYPKLRHRIEADEAAELTEVLRRSTLMVEDPAEPPEVHSSDPGDDYLIALAASSQAVIVSGDDHLLRLGDRLPVYSPKEFLGLIETLPGP